MKTLLTLEDRGCFNISLLPVSLSFFFHLSVSTNLASSMTKALKSTVPMSIAYSATDEVDEYVTKLAQSILEPLSC